MKTYKEFWKELNDEFHFTIDVAADDNNHMCPRYYTPQQDGLKQDWTGEVVWCNPPFGDGIDQWINTGFMYSITDNITFVAMVPSGYVVPMKREPGFIWIGFQWEERQIGRLKFEGQYGFNGDLMLLIFRRK